MSGPLVSVIIPTYNRGSIIGRTIDNVFEQTYRNIEVIVVDDGSTDGTASVLDRYGNRIRVRTQQNSGPAVARNHGVRAARGDIIAFQDSDDLWKPTKIERQVRLLEKDRSVPCCLCNVLLRVVDGAQLTSFDHSLVHPTHEEGLWINILEVLATRFVLFNQAAAIRRGAFERIGGFDQSLKYLEDYDLPLRLAMEGPWFGIREPLVLYSEGTDSSFSQQALRDLNVLRHCEVLIFERLEQRIGPDKKYKRVHEHVKRRLKILRRQAKAIELAQSRFARDRLLSHLLTTINRYGQAAFRRSPWFPQPMAAHARDIYAGY